MYPGFRYATQAGVLQLWLNAGIVHGGPNHDPARYANAAALIQQLGATLSNTREIDSSAFTLATATSPTYASMALDLWYGEVFANADYNYEVPFFWLDKGLADFGNALVRDAVDVPEPSSFVLAALGLIGLVIFRRAGFFARARALAALCMLGLLVAEARAITIDTVLVGNAGNAPDLLNIIEHDENSGKLPFGEVPYDYRIGTTEVTNAQYVEFLNAKAASDPLGLYSTSMGLDPRSGISRSGISGSFTYAAKPNMASKPVNTVSWYDAIRFANWLNNGQGNGDTETGAYTLGALGAGGVPTAGDSITRNVGATWFLPSDNEWYKAAYHQPSSQGGDVDNYWSSPTKSNSTPTLAMANSVGDISNPGTNVANYNYGADWNSWNGNVTTVGSAGQLSKSFYGTSDQGGNVWELNETLFFDVLRGLRGGSWNASPEALLPRFGQALFPTDEAAEVGFRVAMVPEPSSLILAALGLAGLAALGWRRNRRQA